MILTVKSGENTEILFNRARKAHEKISADVKDIVSAVKNQGDKAVLEYTEKFDGVKLDSENLLVTESEFAAAYSSIDDATLQALKKAKENIFKYNERQIRTSRLLTSDGITTGYIVKPVKRAGIYVPGGKAAYPSTVLMCAIPAVVAGVGEIIMCTPCASGKINSLTLAAARECGIKQVFKIGGAQAIAAMAYGTKSIPKVNVISGPGNIFVASAKREVYGEVGIDMIAGPSEILIIADDSANADFVAADMLSQAEHDEMAMSMLITDSEKLASEVQRQLSKQIAKLPRRQIAETALNNYGAIVITESVSEAVKLANKVAPEHLELCVKNPNIVLDDIENAGAVFIGNYSPEPLGDYYAGPNHVLPTGGAAMYASSLGVDNYIKKISIINYEKQALKNVGDTIIKLAEAEGLSAHASAIRCRIAEE
ncbi:MAG: histidinol dehydrogenase [Clostridia bacterium]|nr:histidinol dehydrogenase [Clostridia bacterium]